MKNKQRKEWNRAGKFNRHHLKPRSRGGQDLPSNLIRMDENRHGAWHLLFQNRTLSEVIEILERLRGMKKKQAKRLHSLAEL